ncbi:unnamed protein product [Blepharisma stoltei]|uniref:Odorant receptor n=1 Tax=Blepharisma stoltei TaxID=1481888 RepID=A0AAU9IFQ8_9CILI|nr:unnamed protein product [Blepharisma stoltei]
MSIYMKILLNYLQLITPISAFKLNWSSEVLALFEFQSNTDYIQPQIYSVQCLLQKYSSQQSTYFETLFITALIPFVLIILLIIFWMILKLVKSSFPTFWDDFISTCIILLFLLHSSIVKKMFASMNCTEINNGEYWLEEDLDIKCWNYEHYFYVMTISLPTIIIWGIILPTVCLIALIRDKENLKSINIRVRYGFIFNGYKESKFYWEFIILYSKIVLICCSIFYQRISLKLQAVSATILYTIYFRLQYSNNPYSENDLNRTELRSKFACLFTIYCGLFYLMGSLNEGVSYFLFSLIALINLYFLCFMCFCIAKTIFNKK